MPCPAKNTKNTPVRVRCGKDCLKHVLDVLIRCIRELPWWSSQRTTTMESLFDRINIIATTLPDVQHPNLQKHVGIAPRTVEKALLKHRLAAAQGNVRSCYCRLGCTAMALQPHPTTDEVTSVFSKRRCTCDRASCGTTTTPHAGNWTTGPNCSSSRAVSLFDLIHPYSRTKTV